MKKSIFKKAILFLLLTGILLSTVSCQKKQNSSSSDDPVSDILSELISEEPTPSLPTLTPTPTPTITPTPTPTLPPIPLETEEVPADTVRHIFTHCLISQPEKGTMYEGKLNGDADCITVTEFNRLLSSLYKNNYCLIDINDMFVVDENGKAALAESVTVPKGKKPLVFSVDDVVYDSNKIGNGMVDRLVIHNDTIMAAYYDIETGKETLTDQEIFPQLELFLKDHPDFSYNGAKLTLALTGFNGILGYRTDEQFLYYLDDNAKKYYNDSRMLTVKVNGKTYDYEKYYNIEEERASAKEVADWLKANGYNFACHSYSHSNYSSATVKRVKRDLMLWERNVEPLIGKTNIFIYPYGGFTLHGTEQHRLLTDAGYVMFCGTSLKNTVWEGKHPQKDGTARQTGTIYTERFIMQGNMLRAYSTDMTYPPSNGRFEEGRAAFLEYCIPEEIYCNEERFYKIKV